MQNAYCKKEIESEDKMTKSKFITRLQEKWDLVDLNPDVFWSTLQDYLIKGLNKEKVTTQRLIVFLHICDQNALNPFKNEIYALADKSGNIIPYTGFDGWVSIAKRDDNYNGREIRFSEDFIKIDEDCQPCPEWAECTIHMKNMDHPIVCREYLNEVYKPPIINKYGKKVIGAWQKTTIRRLRQTSFIQTAREALSITGVYSDEEANDLIGMKNVTQNELQESSNVEQLNKEILEDINMEEEEFKDLNGEILADIENNNKKDK